MASSISPNKIYLTPNEVAELLMVSPVTVRSWAQKGVLVAKVTPGGHRRFLKSDVENFVRDSGVAYVEAKPSVSRILIVDNDPLMMTYVYDILNGSGLGFVLATAQNGFEAGAKMYEPFSSNNLAASCLNSRVNLGFLTLSVLLIFHLC
ncbi:helix-turn-helix domain-containing protein [Methylovulum psychrotolerans]|uniref:HTH merR-type domain-containing protein n=1 Tax=Methylovulum psychrotolerans TaxID=1704499 RepID=A0A1Z4C4A1_9GAMM|nr:helix-turn-helix domain-containing protein [Methylovulum psychrotolerans]ASF48386.1 hypothetical protein CEK71_21265 [Methylovulum psychrotolerans]